MLKILALGGSTSRHSINKAFATWAAEQLVGCEVEDIDLNDFPLPLYSVDTEEEEGIPAEAGRFLEKIRATDGVVLSLAEHNGSYAAAFKNLVDWTSRIEVKLWSEKPMLLLSTSPGKRGGASVMAAAKQTFPHLGAKITASFSLPSWNEHFKAPEGIVVPSLKAEFQSQLNRFESSLRG